jgi:CHAT domain-containing protein
VLADPVFDSDDDRVFPGAKGESNRASRAVRAPDSSQSIENMLVDRSAREGGVSDGASFARLPFSRREAEAIHAVARRGEALTALDFDANKATATSPRLKEYRILHFATHGLLNSEHPELSALVFSLVDRKGEKQNGFVRLFDVYNLDLNADLVVLSACRTALGKQVKGEGLLGLTRGFMYAGAERAVASLWKVDDEATAELMKKFYEAMLTDGQRPAAALRSAQLWLRKEKRWQDPYYWAGFVFHGEWR